MTTVTLLAGTPDAITLTYDGVDRRSAGLSSRLKETDGSDSTEGYEEYDAAIDGLESLVLALFCAGVEVESSPFQEGLATALDAIGNHFA